MPGWGGGGGHQTGDEQRMQPTQQREDSGQLIPPSCVFWYLCTFKTPTQMSSSPPGTAQNESHHLPLLGSPWSLPMTVSTPPGRHRAGSPGAAQAWNEAQVLHSSLTRQNKRV